MSVDIAKTYRDGSIQIKDDPSGGNSITLTIEEGDLSVTETRNVNVIMDRGGMQGVRKGDDVPIEWSLSLKFTEAIKQTAASDPSVREAVLGVGAAAAWVSTTNNQSDVFTFDLDWTVTTPKAADSDERVSLEDAWIESVAISEDAEANKIELSGKCLGLNKTGLLTVTKV